MVSDVSGEAWAATAITAAPALSMRWTVEAPNVVPALLATVTSVALTNADLAAVPDEGVAPTLALTAPDVKFVPVTVMVLPM